MQTVRALQLSIYLSIRYNDVDVFITLLPSVPIHEPLANGKTLLQEAIHFKRTEMIYLLIRAGEMVNQDVVNYFNEQLKSIYVKDANCGYRSISSP